MDSSTIEKFEEKCSINLEWFYHATHYHKLKYTSILTEGIKSNQLLGNLWGGTYNGFHYISLSKITIPDNDCFLSYSGNRPSLIIEGIEPIKCEDVEEYDDYIYTEDPRRTGLEGEYQYYYFIKNIYIKGIVYNVYEHYIKRENRFDKTKMKELMELIHLLDQLKIAIPIYDYSRRDKTVAHIIDKDKLKFYCKKDFS